ncbi:MAG: hypothetical protein WCJ30_19250 [Deltaproteobacteria bacterium]
MDETLTLTTTPRNAADGYDRIDIDVPSARVGTVRCRFVVDKVIVYSIQVFPEFQRKGFGRVTVDMLKARFAVVVADRVRHGARGFWSKMGFRECEDQNWEYADSERSESAHGKPDCRVT